MTNDLAILKLRIAVFITPLLKKYDNYYIMGTGRTKMAKEKKVRSIPYGVANYERLVQKNCYYVDKTMYLRTVEKAGDYLFFIRPRRFGKSLFLAVMEA